MNTAWTTSGRWLHAWAILTACAAVPLITLGAEVTTKQVGMVDKAWPTAPWHLFVHDSFSSGLGYLIEHGHRLVGWTVGLCMTVLVIALWKWETRRWLCWLGVAAFLGVGLQGLLGGMRVRLHAWFGPDLAMVHGIFGQIVFALLVSVAVCTSRAWTGLMPEEAEDRPALRRAALHMVLLVLLQLVLGAFLRHRADPLAQRGHLFVAFGVVAGAAWLIKLILEDGDRRLRWLGMILAVLIGLQLLLGIEAWMVKFVSPQPGVPWGREQVRSGHVVVGALVLAASVVVCLETQRRAGWALNLWPVRRLEGRT